MHGRCSIMWINVRLSSLLAKIGRVDYYLNGGRLGKGEMQRDLGVMVHQSLKVGMQVQQAVKKANGMLAFLAKGFEYKSREVLL